MSWTWASSAFPCLRQPERRKAGIASSKSAAMRAAEEREGVVTEKDNVPPSISRSQQGAPKRHKAGFALRSRLYYDLAGAPGLEPGTFGFGDRRTTNCAILPHLGAVAGELLRFAMHLVRPAARTELVEFEPLLMLPLVLRGAVGALFALGTGQSDDYACFVCHRDLPYSRRFSPERRSI